MIYVAQLTVEISHPPDNGFATQIEIYVDATQVGILTVWWELTTVLGFEIETAEPWAEAYLWEYWQ